MTNSVGTSVNQRNPVLHHFNPPSLDRNIIKKRQIGKNTMCSKGQRDADSSISKVEETTDYSFLALQFLLLQCIQGTPYIALQRGNGGSNLSILQEYGRPRDKIFGLI